MLSLISPHFFSFTGWRFHNIRSSSRDQRAGHLRFAGGGTSPEVTKGWKSAMEAIVR